MIIFGISESFRDGKAMTFSCENCGHTAQTTVKYFRYFHLFWLPIIPLGAGQGLVCDSCQQVSLGRQLGSELKRRVKETNTDVRRPVWHFIGTVLVAGMIGYNSMAEDRLAAMSEQAAAEPRVGDVWVVDAEQARPEDLDPIYPYTAARIVDTDAEGATLAFSDWYYGFASTARKQAEEAVREGKEDYFTDEVWMAHDDLVELERQSLLQLVDI
jgi:hypothetical protein